MLSHSRQGTDSLAHLHRAVGVRTGTAVSVRGKHALGVSNRALAWSVHRWVGGRSALAHPPFTHARETYRRELSLEG